MTKKDLERRNQYLLLQLKIIQEITQDNKNTEKKLGVISYYSDPKTIKENIEFIERYNEPYNFFRKTMNIKEYE